MSPRAKNRLMTMAAVIGSIVAVLGLVTAPTATVLNKHFVMTDTFRAFQQNAELRHQRDSLVGEARWERIDTSMAAILRWCHRSGGCQ